MNNELREQLLAMAAEDMRVRAELAADGSLFDGYHPRMEEVHARNAARLSAIIAEEGWPGRSLVGEDGAEAAWRILQHAIGEPALQRRALRLLNDAVEKGEAPAWQAAYLTDRIRVAEGKPQVYGTQFDWDENGELSPMPIENPRRVDELRRSLGLDSLEERIRRMRAGSAQGNERPAKDPAARRRAADDWYHRVGWRQEP